MLTHAIELLKKLNEELTGLADLPLPSLDVETVWIRGLYSGLCSVSLILNDVVLAASCVDPDEGSGGKVAETPDPGASSEGGSDSAPDGSAGSEALH